MIQQIEDQSAAATPGRRVEDELLKTISASRLSTWLGCRLKFYFRYVRAILRPNSPARHIGTVVHGVLQRWNLARWRRNPLDAEAVQAVFEKEWPPDPTFPIAWNAEASEVACKATAFGLLEMYLRETPILPEEKPEGVEVSVEADLSVHGLPILVGVMDLVRPVGRIVDFKTSGQTPNLDRALQQHEVQLTAYAVLYREATGQHESALELHHLVKTKTPKLVVVESPPITDAQISRLFRLIESYVHGIEMRDYVPSPGLACAACEYFQECRNWP